MAPRPEPTGRERVLPEDELIVSKTDPSGVIRYANRTFCDLAGYSEEELLGAPHSIVRHPAMPRAVFAHLWSELEAGREVFAYVVNLAKDGDHYWVLAHVTPTFGDDGGLEAYHSTRRHPSETAVVVMEDLYGRMCAAERRAGPGPSGIEAGVAVLESDLAEAGLTYEQFIFSLAD
ncbi:MAG: PAS domain-containing protein [Planctomycetota bacterium]|jgi:PAS domain S-box-containing protein